MLEEGGPGTTCDEEQGGTSKLHTARIVPSDYDICMGYDNHSSNSIDLQQ